LMGVIPRSAVRPLNLSGSRTEAREEDDSSGGAGHGRSRMVGQARQIRSGSGSDRVVAELAQRVVRAAQQLARDCQRGTVCSEALFELQVVVVVG
jgi:hypothetical protein